MTSTTRRLVAFIPARGGSKGIPGKNIADIGGRPLIHWAIVAACECPDIDRVYVATDSAEIAAVAARVAHRKLCIIGRSPETASDTATTESALLEFAEKNDFTHVVLIQATSPMLKSSDLAAGWQRITGGNADSVVSAVKQKRFLWTANGETTTPINYDPANRPRRQDFAGYFVENGAFYITSRAALLQSRVRISGRVAIAEMSDETYLELDEASDWRVVGHLLQERKAFPLNLREVCAKIKIVLTDVDGVLTDAGMYYSESGDELKRFTTRDGKGMELLRNEGIVIGVVTSEKTNIVDRRCAKLHCDEVHQGIHDKLKVVEQILAKRGLTWPELAYIGDDINDIEVLRRAGFSACPADAVEEAKRTAQYTCAVPGGRGCFREIADILLQSIRMQRCAMIAGVSSACDVAAMAKPSDATHSAG